MSETIIKPSAKTILEKGKMAGFDYLTPEKQALKRAIEEKFREVARLFGFEEVEGPYLQPIEFYQVKSGEELLQNTYTFKDADGQILVLRPELTPTVAYMIAKDSPKLNFPLRWWSNPTLFRKEKPQKGRKRQFKQLNMDIFDRADSGRERAYDEAEIISVACFIFKSVGLDEKDIVIKINSRSLLEKVFELAKLNKNQKNKIAKILDKKDRITESELLQKSSYILKEKEKEAILESWLNLKNLNELKQNPKLSVLAETKEYQELAKVFELLEASDKNKFCEFEPTIIRGLGYYTGTVFEAFEKNQKNGLKRAILGGGRYDNLTQEMGGKIEVTGVGFGFGNIPLEEIILAKKKQLLVKQETDYYLLSQDKKGTKVADTIANILREKGKSVLTDPSLAKDSPDSLSKQLSRAAVSNSQFALILFPKEWQEKKIVVKNLKTQKQETISLDKLLNY